MLVGYHCRNALERQHVAHTTVLSLSSHCPDNFICLVVYPVVSAMHREIAFVPFVSDAYAAREAAGNATLGVIMSDPAGSLLRRIAANLST